MSGLVTACLALVSTALPPRQIFEARRLKQANSESWES
jgi:hypothetical protein